MKIIVLDAETLGADISLDAIRALGECQIYRNTAENQVRERIADADCVVVNKIKLNSDVLPCAPHLKLICLAATGYDNVDIAYCKENGIAVCNIVGYSSHSVSQLTCAMVLALSVNLKAYSDYVTSGEYTESGVANKLTPVYREIFGKTWGIIGLGNTGCEVAAVASALGCNVIVNKRQKCEGFECVSLDELCARADIITIHTPLSEQTRGMISRERIKSMKKEAILVNTARGAICDEQAIADAILSGEIAAFGCDVYSIEPFGAEHPFNKIKHLPNVSLTPHMAWGAYEARCRCIAEIAENISAFKRGERRNRVDEMV